jgi:hypothetical protein
MLELNLLTGTDSLLCRFVDLCEMYRNYTKTEGKASRR